MSTGKLYFKNLDSIRFIAAMMVFLKHAISPSYQYLPIKGTFWEQLLHTISNGGTGVSIFFVLSGFLITYLIISEYEVNKRVSLKHFYIRRVLRIWPLYFMVVIFSFLVYPLLKSMVGVNNPLSSNIFYYLTFLSNFDVINVLKHSHGTGAMSQNITWSVAIEEQFYLFWPLIFVFLPQRFWVTAILIIIAGSIFFRFLRHDDFVVLNFHTVSVFLDLGIGGLVAYLIKEFRKVRTFFENCSTPAHLLFFLFTFFLTLWSNSIFSFHYGAAVERIFISTSFILIIASQAMTKQESILNLGNWKFASRWGKYTYGIYLIHPIALLIIDIFVRTLHIPKDSFINIFSIGIVGFFLTLLISKLSYDYYESKFLRLKDKFTTIVSHE